MANALIRNPVAKWIDTWGQRLATWQGGHAYSQGAIVQPPTPNGYLYECSTAGTTNSSAPTFPTTLNQTVNDGTAVWTCYANVAVLASELAAFDQALASAVNGDDGGTWNPSTPILIQGTSTLSGPCAVARGGKLSIQVATGIQLDDNDWPEYAPGHAGQTRPFMQPCAGALTMPVPWLWRCRWTDGGMQAIAPTVDLSDGLGLRPARIWVPLRVHDGATLSQVTVNFRVPWPHTSLPSVMPSARVIRVGANGIPQPLTSSASGADSSGYVYVSRPASPDAWYDGGAAQTLVVPCDQNNVLALGTYQYYVEIVDEQWTQPGYPFALVAKQPVTLATTGSNITQLSGLSDIDGIAETEGERVLVKDQSDPTQNGIYIVSSTGGWSRAPDWQAAADFTQGMLVPVTGGNGLASSLWQAAASETSWDPGTVPGGTNPWQASSNWGGTHPHNAVPTAANANGYWFEATTAGVSGTTEPAWPNAIGQTVVDNTVTWTCMGKVADSVTFVAAGKDDTESSLLFGTELFAHGTIFQSVVPKFTGITQGSFQ